MTHNRLGRRFQRRLDVPVWLERGPQGLTYAEKVLATEPANLIGYWIMGEAAGGVAVDSSLEGNDGSYVGVTLGQEGIGDGNTCPSFIAAGARNNVYSAAFDADFSGLEGTLFLWVRVANVGVWTDGSQDMAARFRVDGNNYVLMQKANAPNNRFTCFYRAAAVQTQRNVDGLTTVDWFNAAITWSDSANILRMFFNGAQIGADSALGTWVGALDPTIANFGNVSTGGGQPWNGTEAHGMLWNTALTIPQVENLAVL